MATSNESNAFGKVNQGAGIASIAALGTVVGKGMKTAGSGRQRRADFDNAVALENQRSGNRVNENNVASGNRINESIMSAAAGAAGKMTDRSHAVDTYSTGFKDFYKNNPDVSSLNFSTGAMSRRAPAPANSNPITGNAATAPSAAPVASAAPAVVNSGSTVGGGAQNFTPVTKSTLTKVAGVKTPKVSQVKKGASVPKTNFIQPAV